MTSYRIGDAAPLLGVSADTVRRWADAGRLPAHRDGHGHRVIDGAALAAFARTLGSDRAPVEEAGERPATSARNRFTGIVTAITKDAVMAQVELQAGPFRVVSLMSREAADELALEVGAVAAAVVKSTNVIVEVPR